MLNIMMIDPLAVSMSCPRKTAGFIDDCSTNLATCCPKPQSQNKQSGSCRDMNGGMDNGNY